MKARKIIVPLLLAFLAFSVFSQEQQSVDKEKERRSAALEEINNRFDKLRNVGKQKYIRDRYKETTTYQNLIVPLYRDLEEDEIELLAPHGEDQDRYSDYLGKKDRGIIKLIADSGCDVAQEIVVTDEHCEIYKMPGAGASYSFRKRMYRVKRLADLTFSGDAFKTRGLWKHGILISLGDYPIEDLSVRSKELATIVSFEVEMNEEQAGIFAGHLRRGVTGDGLVYKDEHPVAIDTTYVVRSIAYQGRNWELVKDVEYDEFEFDARRDVVVAFRVVRFEPGKSVTIIWKKLSDEKAPKIKSS